MKAWKQRFLKTILATFVSGCLITQLTSALQAAPDDTQIADKGSRPTAGSPSANDQSEQNDNDESVFTGIVTASELNVRVRPSLNSSVLCRIPEGRKVKVFESRDDWYKIAAPESARAWVAKRQVSSDGKAKKDGLRVRCGAALAFSAYATVDKDTTLELKEASRRGWQKIVPPENARAWVSKKYIKRLPDKEEEEEEEEEETQTAKTTTEQEKPREQQKEKTQKTSTSSDKEKEDPDATESAEKSEQPPSTEKEGKQTAAETAKGQKPEQEKTTAKKEEPPEVGDRKQKQPEKQEQAQEETEPAEEPPQEDKTAPKKTESAEETPEEPLSGLTGVEQLQALDDAQPPPGTVRPAQKTGIIVPLGKDKTEAATHVLAKRVEGTSHPLCFLKSDEIKLDQWSMRKVRVSGKEHWYKGWSRPLIKVKGIQVAR